MMAVYVDEAKYNYGRMVMCHMWADTASELHEMADKIGVARKWYQVADGPHRASFPHYDICKTMRDKALRCGAVEMQRHAGYHCRKRIRRVIAEDPAPWRYQAGQHAHSTKDTGQ